jgi:hypothetical protein
LIDVPSNEFILPERLHHPASTQNDIFDSTAAEAESLLGRVQALFKRLAGFVIPTIKGRGVRCPLSSPPLEP